MDRRLGMAQACSYRIPLHYVYELSAQNVSIDRPMDKTEFFGRPYGYKSLKIVLLVFIQEFLWAFVR